MRLSVIGAACLVAASVTAQIVETPVPGDPIAIDSGKVAGKLLPSGVKAYFGVPYAAPPVQDLRWREPQPVRPWQGVFNADRFAPECIQILRPHDINHYFGEEATSEDCLYLNVWAPADSTPELEVASPGLAARRRILHRFAEHGELRRREPREERRGLRQHCLSPRRAGIHGASRAHRRLCAGVRPETTGIWIRSQRCTGFRRTSNASEAIPRVSR